MPKPLLKKHIEKIKHNSLDINYKLDKEQGLNSQNKIKIDRLLHRPRSNDFLSTMHKLDTCGTIVNTEIAAIIAAIKNELPEVSLSMLLGIVAECHLGGPYIIHTLDMEGKIITHYKSGETIPNGLEKARSVALCGSYEFVEVYTDCLRAISEDGSVSVINE